MEMRGAQKIKDKIMKNLGKGQLKSWELIKHRKAANEHNLY
jgi:hypothetical protein